MEYNHDSLILAKSVEVDGVGFIKIPTLDEIWNAIGYDRYTRMCSIIQADKNKFCKILKLDDIYSSLYSFIVSNVDLTRIYLEIFETFIGEVYFDKELLCFCVLKSDKPIGIINDSNFEDVRKCLLIINKIIIKSENEEAQPIKYKNEMAKKLHERMQQAESKNKKNNEMQFTMAKMISKYCANNNCGINITNVQKMTIYQFWDQWDENIRGRQCSLNDMIYSNSVSFSDLKSYDPNEWLKEK